MSAIFADNSETNRVPLSVDALFKLEELGFLHRELNYELIDGEIYEVPPGMNLHFRICRIIRDLLNASIQDPKFVIGEQAAVRISETSLFQPDVVIVSSEAEKNEAFFHPQHVALAVEVSLSTWHRDFVLKRPEYAHAGISELWIVNVEQKNIHVFRNPDAAIHDYRQHLILSATDPVAPQAFPQANISIEAIFAD